jgi:hypothetical protein
VQFDFELEYSKGVAIARERIDILKSLQNPSHLRIRYP